MGDISIRNIELESMLEAASKERQLLTQKVSKADPVLAQWLNEVGHGSLTRSMRMKGRWILMRSAKLKRRGTLTRSARLKGRGTLTRIERLN